MAEQYQTLFGGLAKEFGVTLVAGSIVLPEPAIDNGKLKLGSGPLYNSSVTFGSDGQPSVSRNGSCSRWLISAATCTRPLT